jgi:hypothetical protein
MEVAGRVVTLGRPLCKPMTWQRRLTPGAYSLACQ